MSWPEPEAERLRTWVPGLKTTRASSCSVTGRTGNRTTLARRPAAPLRKEAGTGGTARGGGNHASLAPTALCADCVGGRDLCR
jgi:hypothetical protein